MSTRTAIEQRLAEAQPRLNPRRRRIIQAALENPDETFFLSSRALARRYRVDPATIVRTIQALGYRQYADFLKDLRDHFIQRVTPYRIVEATAREKRSVADHVRHSVERDLHNLDAVRSGLDPLRAVDLARRIHRARSVLIVGVDLAASLAWFFSYGLEALGFQAEAPVGSAGNLQHKVRTLDKRDLVVAISFGRCLRVTIDAATEAKARGVSTFGITDSDTTPIARCCDAYLLAPISASTFTGSYAAPMAVLNAVLVACAQLKPKRSLALLRQTEKEYLSGSRWYAQAPADEAASPEKGTRKR
ncbi:MAG TPA: MurR/RpiR family transcriptional regulator [Thermoanaerobaculia bacterium]|nr:MurR/RpiR family transcriptional regulator [Thermoanaerobaculia bacterium]